MAEIRKTDTSYFESYIPEAISAGGYFSESLVEVLSKLVSNEAKKNVGIGKGPGPHPHRVGSKHIDYGKLRDDITTSQGREGSTYVGTVYTTLLYGMYLEMGWVTKKQNVVRYPWLIPAAFVVWKEDSEKVARDIAKHYFPESDLSIKSSLTANVKHPKRLTGTWKLQKTYRGYTR